MRSFFIGGVARILGLSLLLMAGIERVDAKPFVFEGFVETAPTNFVAPVTHVMKLDAAGTIRFALFETGSRLQSRPLERVRIFGELGSEQTVNGVPLIRVEEVGLAEWMGGESTLSSGRVATWDGFGSSLYPSIAEEPLPQNGNAGSSVTPPPPPPTFFFTQMGFTGGTFGLQLVGESGWSGILEVSTDFVTWTPIRTNTLVNGYYQFNDATASNFPTRFYRARMTAP